MRSLEAGDVQRRQGLVPKPGTHPLGLVDPERREWRVALSVDQRERLAVDVRGRLSVTDQDDLARSGGRLEEGLRIGLGGRAGLGVGRHSCDSTGTSTGPTYAVAMSDPTVYLAACPSNHR